MELKRIWGYLWIIALFNCRCADTGLTCLSCDSALQPTACGTVERCGDHEVCYMDMYLNHVGAIRYGMGCMDQQQCAARSAAGKRSLKLQQVPPHGYYTEDDPADQPILCSKCCHGDLCNSVGCGKSGYQSRQTRGPICFHCADQGRTDDCDTIRMCSADEICMVRRKLSDIGDIEEFESKCEKPDACDRLYSMVLTYSHIVRRFSHGAEVGGECKVQCCNDDICNTGANCNSSSKQTSTSQSTSQNTSTSKPQSTSLLTSQSTSQSTSLSTASSPSQSTSQSTPQSASKPQSTSLLASQSTSQSTPLSTAPSTSQSTSQSASQSTSLSTSQSTSLSPSQSTSQSTSKSTSQNTTQSTLQTSSTLSPTQTACLPSPCHHGTCSEMAGTYRCSCEQGYIGQNCDKNELSTVLTTAGGMISITTTSGLNPCIFNPCLFGHCSPLKNTYVCSCKQGYTGQHCDVIITTITSVPLSACISNPCVHGNCSEYSGTYVCACPDGYYGRNCDMGPGPVTTTTSRPTSTTSLNACLSNPCQHGSCVPVNNTFSCNCPLGYVGDICETKQTTFAPPTPTSHITTSLRPVTTRLTTKDPLPKFTVVAANAASQIHDAAGIAASRVHPGVIYAMNKHGRPEVYALDGSGHIVATFTLHGVPDSAWEDIAVGPCSFVASHTCIYIAETGHHDDKHTIYSFVEPLNVVNQVIDIHPYQKLNFDLHHTHVNAMMVDPDANVYVISTEKELVKIPPNRRDGHPAHPIHLGTVAIPGPPLAADISPDGSEVLIQTAGRIHYWNVGTSRHYASFLYQPGMVVPHGGNLGEALCWDNKGKDFYTFSNGVTKNLYYYLRT